MCEESVDGETNFQHNWRIQSAKLLGKVSMERNLQLYGKSTPNSAQLHHGSLQAATPNHYFYTTAIPNVMLLKARSIPLTLQYFPFRPTIALKTIVINVGIP